MDSRWTEPDSEVDVTPVRGSFQVWTFCPVDVYVFCWGPADRASNLLNYSKNHSRRYFYLSGKRRTTRSTVEPVSSHPDHHRKPGRPRP